MKEVNYCLFFGSTGPIIQYGSQVASTYDF